MADSLASVGPAARVTRSAVRSAGDVHSRPWLGTVVRIAVVIALGGGLIAFASQLDGAQLWRVVSDAHLWPLLVGAALCFVALACKAAGWRVILAPTYRVPVARLWRYTIAAYAASAITPVRAGEALRVWALKQRDGVAIADGAATAVCEKVLDGAAMFALVLPLPWLLPDLPHAIRVTAVVGPSIVLTLIAVLAFVARRARHTNALADRHGPDGWRRHLVRFAAGMHVLHSPRRAALAFAALLGSWLVDLAMVLLVMYAVGIALSPAQAFVVLLTINLAIIVPATPAQVGVHEAGAIAGLALFHIPTAPAVAFALLYHAIQIIPLLVVGLALEWPLIVGRRGVRTRAPRSAR